MMTTQRSFRVVCLSVALLAARVAHGQDIPKEIDVPDGHKLVARLRARGVQIYKAVAAKGGKLEWTLEGPLADLYDAGKGDQVGCHYEGPAWESADGSKVIRDDSEAVKSVPGKDKEAIPWLRIRVKAADDRAGDFAKAVYVQRIETKGGKAPAKAPRRAGTKVGVPYRAVYLLWASEARAAGRKAADLIVGRWEGEGSTLVIASRDKGKKVYVRKGVFEFRADGTLTLTDGDLPELKERHPGAVKGSTLKGKYSFLSAREMELTLDAEDGERKVRVAVAVTKDQLTLTPVGSSSEQPKKYKRLKGESRDAR